jgi:hypothetical protein
VKRLFVSLALAVALSSSALAGDIPSGGIAPPAPGGLAETTRTTPGDVTSVGKAALSSDALSALLSVLSFLAV